MAGGRDMTPRVEALVARHGRYRPIDLLTALRRLRPEALETWRAGDAVLEDLIAGDPERWVELLGDAAAAARKLGLEGELHVPADGRGRALVASRSPGRQQLVCTEYRRVEQGPQMDLFFDNPGVVARNRLIQALLDGDAAVAAERLAALDPSDLDHASQTAAEVLVDALGWRSEGTSTAGAVEFIEQQLEPAARELLDRRSDAYLRRYWREVAGVASGRPFDRDHPEQHSSMLYLRAGDPAGAAEAVRDEDGFWRHSPLLKTLFDAGVALGDRRLMLEAIVELCWCDEAGALACLNRCADPDIGRAQDRFCESEPELPWVLFPAWLALFLPVPELASDAGDCAAYADPGARTALTAAAALRTDPDDIDRRRKLRELAPELFEFWLKRRFR